MPIHSISHVMEKPHGFEARGKTLGGRRQHLLSRGWSGQGRGAWASCKPKDGQVLPGNGAGVGSRLLNLSSNPLAQHGQQRWIFPLLLAWEASTGPLQESGMHPGFEPSSLARRLLAQVGLSVGESQAR